MDSLRDKSRLLPRGLKVGCCLGLVVEFLDALLLLGLGVTALGRAAVARRRGKGLMGGGFVVGKKLDIGVGG